jgi:hypothetical protein
MPRLRQRRSTARSVSTGTASTSLFRKGRNLSTAGSTVAFEIVIDDYAEVWVDGKMPRVLGQPGGPVIKGFNAPNRVIITRDAQPGQHIQLAVFGINGPVSYSPQNFIWIKSATDFYKSPKLRSARLQRRSCGSSAGRDCSGRLKSKNWLVDSFYRRDHLSASHGRYRRVPSLQRSQQQLDLPGPKTDLSVFMTKRLPRQTSASTVSLFPRPRSINRTPHHQPAR